MRVGQFRERVDALLNQGLRDLSLTLAVLARVENDNYEIVAVQSNSGAYVPGEKYDLGNSFSRDVFENRTIVSENNISEARLDRHHPLYRSLPLESYIGVPILIHGQVWGCVDFSSMAPRDEEFDKDDLALVDHLAGEISQLLCTLE